MDLLKRGCSGSTICHFTKIVQRAFLSVLAQKNVQYSSFTRTVCYHRIDVQSLLLQRHGSTCITRSSQTQSYTANINLTENRNFITSSTISSRSVSQATFPAAVASANDTSTAQTTSAYPFTLLHNELEELTIRIHKSLRCENNDVYQRSKYYFDAGGKHLRPSVILLLSKFCNSQHDSPVTENVCVLPSQMKVAFILEMIHAASLVHDDIIDGSDVRRNKPTANALWGNRQAVLIGDFILAKATQVLASIGNPEVVRLLAKIIEDLVRGEFMQLSSTERETERFAHYISKTFKKTASLFAHGCKAAAVLSHGTNSALHEIAFQYGKCIGIAFQLIDDTLDFATENGSLIGKPIAADLKLGLATSPVLFAARQYPELDKLILRRFAEPGDITKAWEFVLQSDGIFQTKMLANQYVTEAIRQLQGFTKTPYCDALYELAKLMVNRAY